eukprot:6512937-Pyramimonas_sp.AAC.1
MKKYYYNPARQLRAERPPYSVSVAQPVINRDPEAGQLASMRDEIAALREQILRQQVIAPPAGICFLEQMLGPSAIMCPSGNR